MQLWRYKVITVSTFFPKTFNSPGENSSFVVERTHLGHPQTWSFPCGSCAVFNSYPGKKVDKMYIAILCSSYFWVKVVPFVFGVEGNETSKFEVTRWSWGYVPWPKDTQSLSSCLACTPLETCASSRALNSLSPCPSFQSISRDSVQQLWQQGWLVWDS